jgi:hypothetical protein
MPTSDEPAPNNPPMPRDELVALVARSLAGSSTSESALAGRALAAQSQLPKLVAENLGAGFGQWDFFPDAADIVDFACAYARPSTEEELWTLARSWASDDAAARPTVMALIGRDVLQQELRRIDVPKLRELVDELKPTRARELRVSLGLEVGADAKAPGGAPAPRRKPTAPKPAPSEVRVEAPAEAREMRMPKPVFKRPEKAAPPPPAKRFEHPKFGAGVLESRDGVGPDAKLTIKFESGSKTLLAKYVTEV